MPQRCHPGFLLLTAHLAVCLPVLLQGGRGKAEACCRSHLLCICAVHPFCLPLRLLPLLLPHTPTHSHVSSRDCFGCLRQPPGWILTCARLLFKEPINMELLPLPPLPSRSQAQLLNKLTEKKGVQGEKSRPLHPPPQRGLGFLGDGQQ